jgi:hypothetical protein
VGQRDGLGHEQDTPPSAHSGDLLGDPTRARGDRLHG